MMGIELNAVPAKSQKQRILSNCSSVQVYNLLGCPWKKTSASLTPLLEYAKVTKQNIPFGKGMSQSEE